MTSMFSRAAVRLDSWLNLLTGVGGGLKRGAFQFFEGASIPDAQLEAIYHGDSFGARICDALPEDALRQGFGVKSGNKVADGAMSARLDDFGVRAKTVEVSTWARVYGGAVLFVGADDGRDPAEPLDRARIQTIRFVTVLDKRELSVETRVENQLSAHFGEPWQYRLSASVGGAAQDTRLVHASRVIRFDGALTSRARRHNRGGWAESELQRVYDQLQAFNGAFAAVGTLIQDASQGVFRMKDLSNMMAADRKNDVKERLEMMDMARSVARSILLDAEGESFERVETSMAGLPDVLDRFMLLLAGASGIPVTRLMGRSPAGLNATGENDIRGYYDLVGAFRANELRPRLERLVRLFWLAKDSPTGGVEPAQWEITFPSLWQSTPSEEADLRSKVATTDVAYITAGVLSPEEVALNRFRADGWTMDTTIDQEVRTAVLAADQATALAPPAPATPAAPAEPAPAPPAPPAARLNGAAEVTG